MKESKVKEIDLMGKLDQLKGLGEEFFDKITRLPQEIRSDPTVRTGLAFFIKIDWHNLVVFEARHPSMRAQAFRHEKVFRMESNGDFASQNSEDLANNKFRGAVKVNINGLKVSAGASGLMGDEDVADCVNKLAFLFQTSPMAIIGNVLANGGQVDPKLFMEEEGHYLFAHLNSLDYSPKE